MKIHRRQVQGERGGYLGNELAAEPINDRLSLTSVDGYMVGFFRVMYCTD